MKEQAGRTGALASLILSRHGQIRDEIRTSPPMTSVQPACWCVVCGRVSRIRRIVTGEQSTSKPAEGPVPRTLVAMPRDVTPPLAAPRYDGFRWLGSQWGRSGKPTPSKVSGTLMLVAAIVVYIVAINGIRNDNTAAAVLLSFAVGTACLISSGFYFVEAHFAGRAVREQEPTEPVPPTVPSVGQ